LDFLDAVVSIHLNIILGLLLYEPIVEMGLKVPLFETRLFAVILLTNVMPRNL
jgi:ESS family glutamate:Na+ symporter